MMRGGRGGGKKSFQIQDAISVKARSWRFASSIELRVKSSKFPPTLQIRAALPTETRVLMEPGPGRAAPQRSTLGSTLLESAAFRGLFTPNSAARTVECAPRVRGAPLPDVSEDDAAGAQRVWCSVLTGTAAFCVIGLGDGTADLQVAEGGATGGRRPPQCPVIYSHTSINISGLQLGSYSEFALIMFVVKLLFTLCLKRAASVCFMELTLSATFPFGSVIISD